MVCSRFLLVCLFCLLAAGCGSGDYQKRINENIESIRKNSIFGGLSEPVTLPGTSLTVKVPKDFTNVADRAKDPAAAKLKTPAPFTLPDEAVAFYSCPRDGEGEAPVYQLFLTKRELPKGRGNPVNDLHWQMREAFPGQEPQWEDVQFGTPAGGSLAWKKLRVPADLSTTVPMEFVMAKIPDGTLGGTKRMPGRVELYMHEHSEAIVLMIWRIPNVYLGGEGKEPEIKIDIETRIKQVGGTLAGK